MTCQNKNFIFIGGCQRSGTTMLAHLLGNMNSMLAVPEAPFKFNKINLLSENNFNDKSFWNSIKNDFRYNLWDIDEINPRASNFKQLFTKICDQYAKKNKVNSNKIKYYIDHTTENLEYSIYLSKLFPNSKFIHIVRDVRGCASSVIKLDWGPNDVFEANSWWNRSLAYGLAAELYLKEKIIRIKFEDIINNPQESLNKIYLFLDLKSNDLNVKTAKRNLLPKYTLNQHFLVGKSLQKSRVYAWKKQLSKYEIIYLEKKISTSLNLLGYSIDLKLIGNHSVGFWFKFYMKMSSFLKRNLVNKLRIYVRKKKN